MQILSVKLIVKEIKAWNERGKKRIFFFQFQIFMVLVLLITLKLYNIIENFNLRRVTCFSKKFSYFSVNFLIFLCEKSLLDISYQWCRT